jgi:AcrR family transcriptional regulator
MNRVQKGGSSLAMARKVDRRGDLRGRLIAAATGRIRSGGLAGLRARDVTSDAGCALGALYTAFSDLDDLIVHVNSATLARLHEAVSEVARRVVEPRERLVALAMAYLKFAREEPALWMSLFEHQMPAGVPVPDGHLAEHAALIEKITEPLAALQPNLRTQELAIRSRTLFSAVHGIVSMGLGNWFVGPGATAVDKELRLLVEAMVSGLQQRSS